jgi:hypothetical protein
LVVSDEKKTHNKKRTAKGIWHLYEFPLIETAKEDLISLLRTD